MRIVHLNANDWIGGAAIAAKRLRDGQRHHGMDSVLWVGDKQQEDPYTFTSEHPYRAKLRFVSERLYFRFFEKSARQRFAFSPLVWGKSLHQVPAIASADIIHIHWINFGFLSAPNLRELFTLKKPIFITLHDMWWITGGCHHAADCPGYTQSCGNCTLYLRNPGPHDLSHRQWQLKFQTLHQAPIHWIACSEWLGNKVRSSSIGQTLPLSVIPNPLDMSIFKPGHRSEAREVLQLSSDIRYVLAVAAKIEVLWKGIDLLIEASQHFPPNTHVLVVGQMDEETAQKFGVPVTRLGLIQAPEKMAQVYQAADVFVLSSRFENLPNTLMEAMGCGIPCVGFSIGGVPEMIDHQVTGYLASPFDPLDLAKGVQLSLENQTEWGNAGYEKASKDYKKEVVVQQILNLYATRLQNE